MEKKLEPLLNNTDEASVEDPPRYVSPQSSSPEFCTEPTEFYTKFPRAIGFRQANESLITKDDQKVHIYLLAAFHELRATVEQGTDDRFPEYVQDMAAHGRWRWFITLATERFERWIRKVRYTSQETFLAERIPPLDVWMVWHAYLLNPSWYAEDCARLPILRQLQFSNAIFFTATRKAYTGELSFVDPSPRQSLLWLRSTETAFDPFDAMSQLLFKSVECPSCRELVTAPYWSKTGNGYSQNNFRVSCDCCSFAITRETLGVFKFVKNLCLASSYYTATVMEGLLAGTLQSPGNPCDTIHAERVKSVILSASRFKLPGGFTARSRLMHGVEREKQILEALGYSMQRARNQILSVLPRKERLVSRMLSAYVDDQPFSVDLVRAVLHQAVFIQNLDVFGWLNFKGDVCDEALDNSVNGYHTFLDFLASTPATLPLVPTLDIEFAWCTHQLMPDKYARDCRRYVGRSIDHAIFVDDEVNSGRVQVASEDIEHTSEMRTGDAYHSSCGGRCWAEESGHRQDESRSESGSDASSFVWVHNLREHEFDSTIDREKDNVN